MYVCHRARVSSSSFSPSAFPSFLPFLFSHCRISQGSNLVNAHKISVRVFRNVEDVLFSVKVFVSDSDKCYLN